jgi:hypothetical protein
VLLEHYEHPELEEGPVRDLMLFLDIRRAELLKD